MARGFTVAQTVIYLRSSRGAVYRTLTKYHIPRPKPKDTSMIRAVKLCHELSDDELYHRIRAAMIASETNPPSHSDQVNLHPE